MNMFTSSCDRNCNGPEPVKACNKLSGKVSWFLFLWLKKVKQSVEKDSDMYARLTVNECDTGMKNRFYFTNAQNQPVLG
jgi:hypothetical protein